MRHFYLLLLAIGLTMGNTMYALNDSLHSNDDTKKRYVGFNSNLLLSQFVPFNQNKITATNASIMSRWYNPQNRGYRAGFGLSLGGGNSDQVLYLSIETDRRKSISNKWQYFQGFGVQMNIVSPGFQRFRSASFQDEYFFGFGWHYGVEYAVNTTFSLSIESSLRLGLDVNDGGLVFKIDPPINIMAHFNISNKN